MEILDTHTGKLNIIKRLPSELRRRGAGLFDVHRRGGDAHDTAFLRNPTGDAGLLGVEHLPRRAHPAVPHLVFVQVLPDILPVPLTEALEDGGVEDAEDGQEGPFPVLAGEFVDKCGGDGISKESRDTAELRAAGRVDGIVGPHEVARPLRAEELNQLPVLCLRCGDGAHWVVHVDVLPDVPRLVTDKQGVQRVHLPKDQHRQHAPRPTPNQTRVAEPPLARDLLSEQHRTRQTSDVQRGESGTEVGRRVGRAGNVIGHTASRPEAQQFAARTVLAKPPGGHKEVHESWVRTLERCDATCLQ
eukprot:Hpha_TRINITY_DN12063_c0_g1::TRINITY_DN12063_c0_g1_i1::g.140964::m.140964